MNEENAVKEILQQVLDVKPEEVELKRSLIDAYEVDSTEMVEISVGLKKVLNIKLADNELKKTHSFNEIVDILKSKGAH